MTCVQCGGRLVMSHTYNVGDGARTHDAYCKRCDQVFTLLTVVVGPATERGDGAYKLAKKLESGEVRVHRHGANGKAIVTVRNGGS